jgi:hypothetical protein
MKVHVSKVSLLPVAADLSARQWQWLAASWLPGTLLTLCGPLQISTAVQAAAKSNEEITMNARDLKDLLAGAPLAIELGAGVLELEAYAEPKMRAHLVAVDLQRDDIAVLKVDYSAFEDFNKVFEQANYYDGQGNPTLTAREAGQYEPQEDLYVMASDDLESQILTILPSVSLALIDEFKASEHTSYVRWLEEQLAAARAAN